MLVGVSVADFGLGAGGSLEFSGFVCISSVRTTMVGAVPIMAPSLNSELWRSRRSLDRISWLLAKSPGISTRVLPGKQ